MRRDAGTASVHRRQLKRVQRDVIRGTQGDDAVAQGLDAEHSLELVQLQHSAAIFVD